jgi:hypothetical protein
MWTVLAVAAGIVIGGLALRFWRLTLGIVLAPVFGLTVYLALYWLLEWRGPTVTPSQENAVMWIGFGWAAMPILWALGLLDDF